jgi:hypothetical protein
MDLANYVLYLETMQYVLQTIVTILFLQCILLKFGYNYNLGKFGNFTDKYIKQTVYLLHEASVHYSLFDLFFHYQPSPLKTVD